MNDGRPTGVCAVIDPERGAHGALELRGPLDAACFHQALHRIAESRPDTRQTGPRLLRHGPELHTVVLPGDDGEPAPYPVGLLADLLTAVPGPLPGARPGAVPSAAAGDRPCGTLPRTEPVTALQQQRLADALARPDHQVEQIVWRWYGPLDTARFEAAWQAVGERESVLRTGFLWDPRPRSVVFERAAPDVVRHRHVTVIRRAALLARERARAFDLRRPGPLRVALLDSGPADAAAPFTDVLLTYHRALLDSWSVRLLMRECCRAYLADGVLPGGERRPDLGDCARWLGAQDLGPAGDFWRRPARRSAPVPPPPAPAAPPPGSGGTGVHRTTLSPVESDGLARWAAHWGVAESSVLQAVWAMLLYRASGAAPRPAVVGFGLDFPGRGLLLEGIEGVPGPFENALPVTVAVDATLGLPGLLRELRDHVLDMAAYEWVAAGELDPGRGGGSRAGGLLAFDCGPRPEESYGDALAAQGIRLEEREATGSPAGYALRLRAGHDARRALVLTCVYDRDLVDGGTARTLLVHAVRLLRLLPCAATGATTVADVLAWLPDAVTPRVPDGPVAREASPLVSLRAAAEPAAATVCLVDVPGAPRTGHWELVRHYRGPEALTALRPTAGAEAAASAVALGRLARSRGRLVLGGYAGAGALACELARRITGFGARPPLVVVGGTCDDPDGPRVLAGALQEASASAARY